MTRQRWAITAPGQLPTVRQVFEPGPTLSNMILAAVFGMTSTLLVSRLTDLASSYRTAIISTTSSQQDSTGIPSRPS